MTRNLQIKIYKYTLGLVRSRDRKEPTWNSVRKTTALSLPLKLLLLCMGRCVCGCSDKVIWAQPGDLTVFWWPFNVRAQVTEHKDSFKTWDKEGWGNRAHSLMSMGKHLPQTEELQEGFCIKLGQHAPVSNRDIPRKQTGNKKCKHAFSGLLLNFIQT